MEYELIDVTSPHRVKPSWRFKDAAGHVFQWHDSRGPARRYDPIEPYHVPGTRRVDTDERRHLECLQCGAKVEPGYTADWSRRFVRL